MQPHEISRAKAEHVFTRSILHDLMVELCMRDDDPIGETDRRAALKIGAADKVGATAKDQLFNQLLLHELETFWDQVRDEVSQRVEKGY